MQQGDLPHMKGRQEHLHHAQQGPQELLEKRIGPNEEDLPLEILAQGSQSNESLLPEGTTDKPANTQSSKTSAEYEDLIKGMSQDQVRRHVLILLNALSQPFKESPSKPS